MALTTTTIKEKSSKIDYEEILYLVKNNLTTVMNANYSYYKDYNVVIANEQQFIKSTDKDTKNIYIVLRYAPATINYGQTILPVTISAMAEQDKLETCQRLLTDFALSYNLERNTEGTIQQIYETPSVNSVFNVAMTGFRALMSVSATFVISKNANFFTISYKGETIDFITATFGGDTQLDTQAFYGNNNFTKSEAKMATITLSFSTYLLYGIGILDDVIDMYAKTTVNSSVKVPINNSFTLTIEFKNGTKLTDTFKCSSFSDNQQLGDIPMAAFTFTN